MSLHEYSSQTHQKMQRRLQILSSHLSLPNFNHHRIDSTSGSFLQSINNTLEYNSTNGMVKDEKSRAILMNKFPKGMIEESDFKMVDVPLEQVNSSEGDWIKIQLLQLSVDPYMRAR